MNFRNLSIISIFVVLFSLRASAQTDGPIQREFIGSSGVTGAQVDQFTGDFHFGIPVITVPGGNGFNYSLNLTYKSGVSPMEAASWVGFGWSLSPGAIIRGKNGFPDDYKGAKIKKWYKVKPNITVSVAPKAGIQAFSTELFSISSALYYNNYKGYKITDNFGFLANLIRISWDEESGYQFGVDPVSIGTIIKIGEMLDKSGLVSVSSPININLTNILDLSVSRGLSNIISNAAKGPLYTTPDFIGSQIPKFSGFKLMGEYSGNIDFGYQTGGNIGVNASYDEQDFDKSTEKKAYGSLYNCDVNINDPDAVMDFSSDRSFVLRSDNSYLPIPYGGEDNFIITGSGMSGSFRFHYMEQGDFKPEIIESAQIIFTMGSYVNVGTDFGGGEKLSVGAINMDYGGLPLDNFKSYPAYTKGDGTALFIMNGDLGYQDYNGNPGNLFQDPFRGSITTALFGTKLNVTRYDLKRNDLSKGSYSINYVTRREIANDIKQFITSYNVNNSSGATIHTLLYGDITDTKGFIDPQTKVDKSDNCIDYRDNPELKYYPQFSSFDKKPFKLYTQWTHSEDPMEYYRSEDDACNDEVEEFQITNPNGSIYVYGQAVYARNERDLSYGIDLFDLNTPDARKLKIFSHLTTEENAKTVIGTESNQPYACAYLLTQILSPDYVDLTMNGPTPDDLGDYVKFNYRKVFGTPWITDNCVDQWSKSTGYDGNRGEKTGWSNLLNSCAFYKWRFPYNGLDLILNSISNNEDDYGHVQMGEREVYYLESIETKTHIAYFVTNHTHIARKLDGTPYNIDGDNVERNDGWEASHFEWETTGNRMSNYSKDYYENDKYPTMADFIAAPVNKMEKLEKIVLFQKDPKDTSNLLKLIQTTRFDYNYDAWKAVSENMIGCENTLGDNRQPSGLGKLTLNKVWFESNGVKNFEISPYYFDYVYPDVNDYPAQYQSLAMPFSGSNHLSEKPGYDPNNVDRWGNYMVDGIEHKLNQIPYVPQNVNSNFDPAAWNLKQITMPGGARIDVQYEQKDYLYVQDRRASVMANIDGVGIDPGDNSNSIIRLNLADLSSRFQLFDKDSLLYLMRIQYVVDGKLLYCRFLNDFYNSHTSETSLWGTQNYPFCSEEFIDTYVKVLDVNFDSPTNPLFLEIKVENGSAGNQPWFEAAWNFYLNNKVSDYNGDQGCYGNNGINTVSSPDEFVSAIKGCAQNTIAIMRGLRALNYCKNLNKNLSFVRIPVINKKLGGGIRVKRLLYLDKFNKNIDLANENDLYGYEYIYRDEFGRSSGVAANEPAAGREENSLIEPLVSMKNEKNFGILKYATGDYLVRYMGPIGQRLLPSPSIGYSRVLVKNIFEGRTDQGLAVNEFFTTKDYPFDMKIKSSSLGTISANQATNVDRPNGFVWENFMIPPFLSFVFHETKLTQGYQFVLNSMNGKPKKSTIYGGQYRDINSSSPAAREDDIILNISNHPSSETIYKYFEPGDYIPMFYGFKNDGSQTENDIRLEYPGRRIDICSEYSQLLNICSNVGLKYDITISALPPFNPISSYVPNESYLEDDYQTYVTNKTISYPAIVKEIETTTEGVTRKVQNVALDPRTGMPVIQRTVDGYDSLALPNNTNVHDGAYYSYNFLASTQYPNFTQINESPKFYPTDSKAKYLFNKRSSDYELQINSQTGCDGCYTKFFSNGDFLRLTKEGKKDVIGYYWVKESSVNLLKLTPLFDCSAPMFAGTSFDIPVSHPNINTMPVDIEVLKSGRNNELTASVGSVTTYGQSERTKVLVSGKVYTYEPKPPVRELDAESVTQTARRQGFVDWLNAKIKLSYDGFISGSGTSYTYNYSNASQSPVFIDENGTERIYDGSTDPLTYLVNSYDIIIKVKRIGKNVRFEISHKYESKPLNLSGFYDDLANDLNDWLDKSWSTDLSGLDSLWNVCSECEDEFDPPCDKQENQMYINRRINLRWPKYFDAGLGDKIDEITGLNNILNRSYLVNGRFVKGKELFVKNFQSSSPGISMDPDLDDGLSLIIDNTNIYKPKVYIGVSWLFINDLYGVDGYNIGFARHFNEYGDYSDPYYAKFYSGFFSGLFNPSLIPSSIKSIETGFRHNSSYLNYSEFLDGLSRQKSDCKNYNRFFEPVQKENDLSMGTAQEKSLFTWHKGWIKPPLMVLKSSNFYNANHSEYSSLNNFAYQTVVDADNTDLKNTLNLTSISPYKFSQTNGHFIINNPSANVYDLCYEAIEPQTSPSFYPTTGDPFQDNSNSNIKILIHLQDPNTQISNECSFDIDVLEKDLSNHGRFSGNIPSITFIKPGKYQLTYDGAECDANICISFPEVHYDWKFQNVVSSSASTLSDDWHNNFSLSSISALPTFFNPSNEILEAKKGKWRENKSLGFSSILHNSGSVGSGTMPLKGYDNGGLILNGCDFNWHTFTNLPRMITSAYTSYGWVVGDSITGRDEDGRVLETIDNNGVFSSVKYDPLGNTNTYSEALPSIQAVNADTNEIFFESFESYPNGALGSSGNIVSGKSHTGKKSENLTLTAGNDIDLGLKFNLKNDPVLRKCDALIVDLWLKVNSENNILLNYQNNPPNNGNQIYIVLTSTTNVRHQYYGQLKAIVNNWGLFEFTVNDYAAMAGHNYIYEPDIYSLKIKSTNPLLCGHQLLLIDDIRIIPACATANCFVYDYEDHKILATLDNDHFATIYQYNYENSPVRVIAETYKGLKTVSESQANILKNGRSSSVPQFPLSIQNPNNYWNDFNNGTNPNSQIQQIDEKFDIFKIEISPKGKQIKLFDKQINLPKSDSTNTHKDDKIKSK